MEELVPKGHVLDWLYSKEEIAETVGQIADQINMDPFFREPFVVVPVMFGSFMFCADLLRLVHNSHVWIRPLLAKSYIGNARGNLLIGPVHEEVRGRNVLVIEDIVDSGETLAGVTSAIYKEHPKSVRVASMFVKGEHPSVHYLGLPVPKDNFVVGYGLDHNGMYRQLPALYNLKEV